MARRHAAQALLATVAVSALTVGGFGVLTQSTAAGAQAQPAALCLPPLIPCPTPTATDTSTPTPAPTVTATTTATVTVSPSSASTATTTAQAKPKPSTNVTLTGLRIATRGRTLSVSFTVTNTGTLSVGGYLITAHLPGYKSRAWLANLPVGQPIQVHGSWKLRGHGKTLKLVVRADPRHQVTESDRSDNSLTGTVRVR